MTTISAEVVLDSINERGNRLTTLMLVYPRIIHSEFMTHRMFSRNASSSRAIPVSKSIDMVENDMMVPLYWEANRKGMQGGDALPAHIIELLRNNWIDQGKAAINAARGMMNLGLHKQIVNRLLEPFNHIRVLVSATDWENFFTLRDSDEAEPHMQDLARAIRRVMETSEPQKIAANGWHLPFVDEATVEEVVRYNRRRVITNGSADSLLPALMAISAARCARLSYMAHDGSPTSVEADLTLAEKLSSAPHLSPFEHQATPCYCGRHHANFQGWVQHRRFVEQAAEQEKGEAGFQEVPDEIKAEVARQMGVEPDEIEVSAQGGMFAVRRKTLDETDNDEQGGVASSRKLH